MFTRRTIFASLGLLLTATGAEAATRTVIKRKRILRRAKATIRRPAHVAGGARS